MQSITLSSQQLQQQQQQSYENNVAIGKTPTRSSVKTPQHSRRALGDISNRKVKAAQLPNNNINDTNNNNKTPLQKVVPSSSNITKSVLPVVYGKSDVLRTTGSTNLQPQQQVSSRLATVSKRNHNVTFILPDDDIKDSTTTSTTTTKKAVAVVEPKQVVVAQAATTTVTTNGNSKPAVAAAVLLSSSSSSLSLLWNYEDESEIELPAGRLYCEQQQQNDYDDDDASILSLEGAKTFRQEYINLLQVEHIEQMQEKENYIQYCIDHFETNCMMINDNDDVVENIVDQSFDNSNNKHSLILVADNDIDTINNETIDSIWIDFPPSLVE